MSGIADDAPLALHLVVSGRVQGVGYREWARRQAVARGLRGWVRNRSDGTVEMVVAGAPDAVNEMAAICRSGPPLAEVAAVAARPAARDEPDGQGFAILPTR